MVGLCADTRHHFSTSDCFLGSTAWCGEWDIWQLDGRIKAEAKELYSFSVVLKNGKASMWDEQSSHLKLEACAWSRLTLDQVEECGRQHGARAEAWRPLTVDPVLSLAECARTRV